MTDGSHNRWRDVDSVTRESDHPVSIAFADRDKQSHDAQLAAIRSQQQTNTPATFEGLGDSTAPYETSYNVAQSETSLEIICGPLLNYKWMSNVQPGPPIWYGSVLVITKTENHQPRLILRFVDRIRGYVDQHSSAGHYDYNPSQGGDTIDGIKLYADPVGVFWRFDIELRIQEYEARWEYSIPNHHYSLGDRSGPLSAHTFVVPAVSQSMRIMFHSCNGFSVGTDLDTWKGPVLWNDVMRVHHQKPFHVMIGGGDQIYNDGVRVGGPLREWTDINNPRKRREYLFDESLRKECDRFYFDNYIKWYSSEPFATANGQIPQVNIWDDHGTSVKPD
jgi:hypothetical protein